MLTAHLHQKLTELLPKQAPFAIAFSGGGDSTALVHALKDHPQAKRVYSVDHNLRSGSDAEAMAAKSFAIACGYDARILKWKHNSPKTAIQEKARFARYGLMGEQCRRDGIAYLLTAHSEDDQAETLLMRYERKTDWRGAAGMAELSYGAVWPELASVNVARPLLGVTRQSLRDYNLTHKLRWAEDPSNENRDYARIRARDYLKLRPELRKDLLDMAVEMRAGLNTEKSILRQEFSRIGQVDQNGIIRLTAVPRAELMFHCLRCAGGQGVMIDRSKIKRLLSQMRLPSFKSATLGGAMVAQYESGFVICRDPVAVKGRQDSHHARIELRHKLNFTLRDFPQLWDGRFFVSGTKKGCHMSSVLHERGLINEAQKKALKTIARPAQMTLPLIKEEGAVHLLGVGQTGFCSIESAVGARLEAMFKP